MSRLNGTKVLVKGNHDRLKASAYLKWFKDIRAFDRFDKYIMAHVPVHPTSFGPKCHGQIHGHTHYRCLEDKRYLNVSVECTNYTPISADEVLDYFKREVNYDHFN